MTYGTVLIDAMQTSSGQVLGAGNATGFKNRIINGDMRIDQRNAGASVTPTVSGTFVLDRWRTDFSQASKFSVQQTATAISGFVNSMKITSLAATSVGASDYFVFSQPIEGNNVADFRWGTASAKTARLTFSVNSSLTGTFGGSIRNGNGTRSYPFSYSIPVANTDTTISITVPGDTTGTWSTDNSASITAFFGLGVGSTFSAASGAWAAGNYFSATGATSVVGTSGATFYITGVQLEVGSTATSFDVRDYGRELILCQRYLPAFIGSNNIISGIGQSTTSGYGTIVFPVQTRVPPTGVAVNNVSNFNMFDAVALYGLATSITFNAAGTSTGNINYSCAAGVTATRTTFLGSGSNAIMYFTGCEL